MLEPDAATMFRLEIGAAKHNDLDESRAGHYAPRLSSFSNSSGIRIAGQ